MDELFLWAEKEIRQGSHSIETEEGSARFCSEALAVSVINRIEKSLSDEAYRKMLTK